MPLSDSDDDEADDNDAVSFTEARLLRIGGPQALTESEGAQSGGHTGTVFINSDWVTEEAATAFDAVDDGETCRE